MSAMLHGTDDPHDLLIIYHIAIHIDGQKVCVAFTIVMGDTFWATSARFQHSKMLPPGCVVLLPLSALNQVLFKSMLHDNLMILRNAQS